MEAMGQYVHLRVAPGHKLPVQPNPAVTIIEGNQGHRDNLSYAFQYVRACQALQPVPLCPIA